MTSQKGFAHAFLIIGLVVALVGALGFVFWQNFVHKEPVVTNTEVVTKPEPTKVDTVDPYANWKTYKSERDGYLIKYPDNWIVINETNQDGPYIRNFDPSSKPNAPKEGTSNYPEGYINLRVLLEKNNSNFKSMTGLSTIEWYSKLGDIEASSGPVTYAPSDVRNITVNKLNAKSAKSVFSETNEDIYFLQGSELYTISLFPYRASSNSTIKLMLDSFEFI